MRQHRCNVLVLATLLLQPGCRKDELSKTDTEAKPSHEETAERGLGNVDPGVATALGKLATGAPGGGGTPAGEGPPPGGIFRAGEADTVLPPGKEALLAVGSTGEAPKVSFSPALMRPGKQVARSLLVSFTSEPGRPPIPVSMELVFKVISAPRAGGTGSALPEIVATVKRAEMVATGGAPSAEVVEVLRQMGGVSLTWSVSADGGTGAPTLSLPARSGPVAADLARGIAEVLTTLWLAYPTEPLGVGAYWLVTSRQEVSGVKTLTYRMAKIVKVIGAQAVLSLDTKRYALSPEVTLPGVPPTARMVEFAAPTNGQVAVDIGQWLPIEATALQSVSGTLVGALPAAPSEDKRDQEPQKALFQNQIELILRDPALKPAP